MLHRIREAFAQVGGMFFGDVAVDETFIGGLEENKHEPKKLKQGRGASDKATVIGAKERGSKNIELQVVRTRIATPCTDS